MIELTGYVEGMNADGTKATRVRIVVLQCDGATGRFGAIELVTPREEGHSLQIGQGVTVTIKATSAR